MKSWKTTIIGGLIGGLIVVDAMLKSGATDIKQIITGFLVAALGAVAKDFNATGGK